MKRLQCTVKTYDWGKMGNKSEVARLFAAGHKEFRIEDDTSYAELWMGTHPDGPAVLEGSYVRLSSFIAKSQSVSNLNKKEDIHLPFIMKVMSIRKTLSLQVHPTKEQAARLHARDPIHYPDKHHKPELAYALTRFELLCGFRPAEEILTNFSAFPSLTVLLDKKNCSRLTALILAGEKPRSVKCREALAWCFGHMMEMSRDYPSRVEELVEELLEQLDKGARGSLTEDTVGVIRKMAVDFPGDVGIFSPLLLNHMILQPGECCYYAAEELHAYLSGECVECVGCSNNTIRAAMTPKFIDREALCEVLNYRMTPPEEYLVSVQSLSEYPGVDEYAPDCKDFQLHRIRVPSALHQVTPLPVLECASIMVIVKGSAILEEVEGTSTSGNAHKALSTIHLETLDSRSVTRGDIIYIPPGRRLRFVACNDQVEAYRTFSYEAGPDHGNIMTIPAEAMHKPVFAIESDNEEWVFEVESEMDGFI